MIALLVAGAFFMENLDGTVIGTAVPQMARTFGVKPVDLNIGMTSYLLALAVFIPISGWLADRFGARTIFGGASTLSSMVQQMTFGMGIAFGAIALRLAGLFHPANTTESLTVGDFRIAFGLVGSVALLGVIDAFSLASHAGAEVSGHRRGEKQLPKASSLRRPQSSV